MPPKAAKAVTTTKTVPDNQKSAAAKVTLDFATDQHSSGFVREGKKASDPITIEFRTGVPTVRYEPDTEEAHKLPLTLVYESFKSIRLSVLLKDLSSTGGTKAANSKDMVGHLRVLLTGHERLDPSNRWHSVFGIDYKAMSLESKAQEAQLGRFKGCRIVTSPNGTGRALIAHVYLAKQEDQDVDDDLDDVLGTKIGLSFFVNAPKLLPVDEETLKAHSILGMRETEGWELLVLKTLDDSDADIVGTFANTFPNGDIDSFIGEDHGVMLDPIFRDVSGQRQRYSLSRFGQDLDNESKKLRGFFVDEKKEVLPKSKLPVDMLFSGPECVAAENALPATDMGALADIVDRLDPTQTKAFTNAMDHAISVAQGPPGTGKSSLIGATIRALIVKGENIAATASSNVAVNNLLEAALSFWNLILPGIQPPFARIFSESQILSQWAMRDLDALKDSEEWGGYLQGREVLTAHGIIDDKGIYKAYKNKELSTKVLASGMLAVFCTVTGAQSSALYQEDKATSSLNWFYPANTIIVDEAKTIWRPALMMLVMTFRDTARLILAGDPLQLSGLLLDTKTRSLWKKSYLQDIMDRKFPRVILGKQYRMHDCLYAATAAVIYKIRIIADKLTSNPSAFRRRLLASPITVNVPQASYELRSFLHFLDVPHGVQELSDGSSSFNQAEVEVVNSLVLSLLDRGVAEHEGSYTVQKKALEDAAKANASQGTENFVMILSLVKTDGLPGFIGKKQRANVATSRQKEALYFVGKEAILVRKDSNQREVDACDPGMHECHSWFHRPRPRIRRWSTNAGAANHRSASNLAIAGTPHQPENTKQAALEALRQRHQVEIDELLTEQLAVREPLTNQVDDLLAKRSEVQQVDLDRIDAEIQRLDEVLKARQDESNEAILSLTVKHKVEVQELEAEKDNNNDDLYSVD
ncbi:MAG: hypothetical protein Q9176_007975 [Flavoplaca citrina]